MANAKVDELVALADEKGTLYWKAEGMLMRGCRFCHDRQGLGRSPNDHLLAGHVSVNGSNMVDPGISGVSWRMAYAELGSNSMTLGAALAKR